ncbi:MAG TPA: TIGR02594 family protein [Pseudolabrys sp.]|nr:TIGR02594 family protein [Pseudolabrys sp.]
MSQADSNTIAYPQAQQIAVPPARSRSRRISRRAAAAFASADAAPLAGLSLGGGDLVSQARSYLGTNPTGKGSLWCGNFMNLVLERSGYRPSQSNTARSFASYGHRISGPQVGAIAVMGRRGGGHVGVVAGIDPSGNPILISGNHNRTVAESVYPRGRIYAYVMPN